MYKYSPNFINLAPDSDESEPYQKNSPPPRTPSIPVDSSVETPVKELVFIPPPPTVTIQLDMSGEEAYLMRMRMSGMTESDLPNTIPIPDIPDDDDDDDDIDGAPITKTQDQDIDGAPMNNIEEEDEDLDGEPLNENIDGELLSIADISHSTVLLLTNMVGRTEVDDTLESETFEECSNFGPVEKCVIHVHVLIIGV
ncbi:hypothetical protein HK098_002075 [Nowakowskiella sp. JEL0407]|nr:hypothetical protein HK098_002075 [Nowakowskiella sp. JEL0407]